MVRSSPRHHRPLRIGLCRPRLKSRPTTRVFKRATSDVSFKVEFVEVVGQPLAATGHEGAHREHDRQRHCEGRHSQEGQKDRSRDPDPTAVSGGCGTTFGRDRSRSSRRGKTAEGPQSYIEMEVSAHDAEGTGPDDGGPTEPPQEVAESIEAWQARAEARTPWHAWRARCQTALSIYSRGRPLLQKGQANKLGQNVTQLKSEVDATRAGDSGQCFRVAEVHPHGLPLVRRLCRQAAFCQRVYTQCTPCFGQRHRFFDGRPTSAEYVHRHTSHCEPLQTFGTAGGHSYQTRSVSIPSRMRSSKTITAALRFGARSYPCFRTAAPNPAPCSKTGRRQ